MALWQISFDIIKKSNVEEIKRGNLEEKIDKMLLWCSSDVSLSAIRRIEKYFGIGKSWSKKLKVFGSLESTAIEIFNVDEMSCEMSCRYSVIEHEPDALLEIISFIKEIDGVAFYGNQVYEPEFEVFLKLIRSSEAARFIVQQKDYFNNK